MVDVKNAITSETEGWVRRDNLSLHHPGVKDYPDYSGAVVGTGSTGRRPRDSCPSATKIDGDVSDVI
jgi:hypothetical protein